MYYTVRTCEYCKTVSMCYFDQKEIKFSCLDCGQKRGKT